MFQAPSLKVEPEFSSSQHVLSQLNMMLRINQLLERRFAFWGEDLMAYRWQGQKLKVWARSHSRASRARHMQQDILDFLQENAIQVDGFLYTIGD